MSKEDFSWLSQGRYIFFSSLYNKNREIYDIGQSRLSNFKTNHTSNSDDTNGEEYENFTQQIDAYLNMLQSWHQMLLNSERMFLQSNLSILKENNQFNNITSILEKMQDGTSITEDDYSNIIAFINFIQNHGDLTAMQENIKTSLNNISHLNKNFLSLTKEEKQTAIHNYITSPKNYNINAGKLMRTIRIDDTFVSAYIKSNSQYYAERVNKLLASLSDSEQFKQLVYQQYEKYKNDKTITVVGSNLTKLILSIVSDTITKDQGHHKGEHTNKLTELVIQRLEDALKTTNLHKDLITPASGAFTHGGKRESFEEIAMLHVRENLSQLLETATNAEQIINKYDKNKKLLNKWKNLKKLIAQGAAKEQIVKKRREFNASLRENIKSAFSNREVNGQIYSELTENKDKIKFFSNRQIQKTLSFMENPLEAILPEFANGCKLTISKNTMAELLAANHIEENIPGMITGKLPGSLNMKDDVTFILDTQTDIQTLLERETEASIKPLITDINNTINQYLEQTLGNFVKHYHDAGGGATDVELAEKTYIEDMKTLMGLIEKYLSDINADEDIRTAVLNKLNNTLVGGISVKDYSLYNNEIGYHGGSLGGSGAPEAVVNNITKMYELGGISPYDKEALLFAILNCAPSAIGSHLKDSLEAYLLGGAAMIMFDEGFSIGKKYLQDMKEQVNIENFSGPKTLGLYYLNLTYVPSSYILYNIYQSLLQFYHKLPSDIHTVKVRNRVVINNNASESLIPDSGSLPERFKAAATAAEKQITIQFLFMAGMLDILNNLQNSFNIK